MCPAPTVHPTVHHGVPAGQRLRKDTIVGPWVRLGMAILVLSLPLDSLSLTFSASLTRSWQHLGYPGYSEAVSG